MRCTIVLVASVLSVSSVGASSGPAKPVFGSWVRVTDKAAFSPRDTAEDLVYAGKMWLSNAYYHGNKLTRDLWSSKDGATWTRVNASTPYDGYSEMIVYGGRMWAIKGSVWSSKDGVAWERVAERTPFGARGYGEVVVHQGKVWQLGSGQDVWNTTDCVTWARVTEKASFGKRAASAVVVHDGKLWLMGGRTPGANTPPEKGYKDVTTHNDVWCSKDGRDWRRVLAHAPWAPRQWHISKTYRGRIWIVGGHDNVKSANFGDVWYSEDGKTWHEFVSKIAFSPRHEVTCYVYDDSFWVVAGNAWPVQNDVWRLTLPQSAGRAPR